MSKLFEKMKEFGPFMVLTKGSEYPEGRPFGALMELNDKLYIATSNKKKVYEELVNDSHVSLLSLKGREWIRVRAISKEVSDLNIKQKMLDANPVLITKYQGGAMCKYLAVFELDIKEAYFINDNETINLV